MKQFPKISIITPSYNQGNFIEQTINSVLKQDYPNLEFIIIDGGSTDQTIKILQKYNDKIIWLSEKDQGQTDAINKGCKMATGEIIAFINSDDTYINNSLFKVAEYFSNNPKKKWLYGKCRIINEKNIETRKFITWYKNILMKKYSYTKLLCVNFICQPTVFWRKEIFSNSGFFDTTQQYAMDYDFWLRIGQKYPAGFINDRLANFRFHHNSKSAKSFNYQFADDLSLAKKYTNNKLIILVHYLHNLSILFSYKLINKFSL